MSCTLCESLSRIAGISADSGFVWIQRNNITAVLQPLTVEPIVDSGQSCKEALQSSSLTLESEKLQKPAIQALSVLSNVGSISVHTSFLSCTLHLFVLYLGAPTLH